MKVQNSYLKRPVLRAAVSTATVSAALQQTPPAEEAMSHHNWGGQSFHGGQQQFGDHNVQRIESVEESRTADVPPKTFLFEYKKSPTPTGTEPKPSDQGMTKTCASHALAKTIQAWLNAQGWDADHRDLVNSLLNKFPVKSREFPRNPDKFNDLEIVVTEKDEKGEVSGRTMTVHIKVQTVETHGLSWTTKNKKKQVWTSPKDMLAVGCFWYNSTETHAAYIKSYNSSTKKVETINSHGDAGELPAMDDTQFYSVSWVWPSKVAVPGRKNNNLKRKGTKTATDTNVVKKAK